MTNPTPVTIHVFAIYLNRGPKDKDHRLILTLDGYIVDEGNCLRESFDVVLHRPRLYKRKRDAYLWLRANTIHRDLFEVREYHGPTKSWSSTTQYPASLDRVAIFGSIFPEPYMALFSKGVRT